MAAQYGAHEVMEIHEVLTCAIDAIHNFQLYRPHVQDQQLGQMLDHQLQFMMNEYSSFVQMLNGQAMQQAVPYRAPKNAQPVYGLRQPGQIAPNMSSEQMDDRDVACAMLGAHKAAAGKKMLAALECADPQIRRLMQQAAINCSEQAYEVWQFMNQQGWYQVPTMKDVTTQTMLNMYASPDMNQNQHHNQMTARMQTTAQASRPYMPLQQSALMPQTMMPQLQQGVLPRQTILPQPAMLHQPLSAMQNNFHQ